MFGILKSLSQQRPSSEVKEKLKHRIYSTPKRKGILKRLWDWTDEMFARPQLRLGLVSATCALLAFLVIINVYRKPEHVSSDGTPQAVAPQKLFQMKGRLILPVVEPTLVLRGPSSTKDKIARVKWSLKDNGIVSSGKLGVRVNLIPLISAKEAGIDLRVFHGLKIVGETMTHQCLARKKDLVEGEPVAITAPLRITSPGEWRLEISLMANKVLQVETTALIVSKVELKPTK